ncbi:MAG: hypothetical protein U9Q22_04050 [Candidatus Altiarchaeota archaeon]|nr:hypothetical protein [Candidatus Altiarchaeota archaeon]
MPTKTDKVKEGNPGEASKTKNINRHKLKELKGYTENIKKLITLTDQVDADIEALKLQNETGKDIDKELGNLENQLQKIIADIGINSFDDLGDEIINTKKNNVGEIDNLGKKSDSIKTLNPEKVISLIHRLNKLKDQNKGERNLVNIKTELRDIEGVIKQIEGDSEETIERIKRLKENINYLSKLIDLPPDIKPQLKKLGGYPSNKGGVSGLEEFEDKLRDIISKTLPGTDIKALRIKVRELRKVNEVGMLDLGRTSHNIRKLVGKRDDLMDSFDILHGLRERNTKEQGLINIKDQIAQIKTKSMEDIQELIRNDRVAKTCSEILEGKDAGGVDIPEIVNTISKANTEKLAKLRKCTELTRIWLIPGYRFRGNKKLDDLERRNKDDDGLIHIGDELDEVELALKEDICGSESVTNVKAIITFVTSLAETDNYFMDIPVYHQLTKNNWGRDSVDFILNYERFIKEVEHRRMNLVNLIDTVNNTYPLSIEPKKTVHPKAGEYPRFMKYYRSLLKINERIKEELSLKFNEAVKKTDILSNINPNYLSDLGYLKDGIEIKINNLRGNSLEENPTGYLNKLVEIENDINEFDIKIRENALKLFTADIRELEMNIVNYTENLGNISY